MWRATIRGILARKVRLLLTALAVILGVSFISATFVLTDTIKSSYGQVLSQFGTGSEIVITSTRSAFSPLGFGGGGTVDQSSLPIVSGVPGVAAASGVVQTDGITLLDRNGKPITGGFNTQTLGISWPQSNAGPFELRAGRPPTAPDEVAIDATFADRNGYALGDAIDIVVANGGKQSYRIVGTVGLGDTSTLGGVIYAAFDLPTAQQLFQTPNRFDVIFVRVAPDAEVGAVARELQRALGPEFAVINTEAFVQSQAADSNEFFTFFNRFILGFGVLGVFVGGFIIANTFVILVQQRTRELALLRALGASGRQVRYAVLFEALALGFVASLLGFVAGIGLGIGGLRLLTAIGLDIPEVEPVVNPRTFLWALAIGVSVTVVSAIWPANRAAETAPMAAIADVAPRPTKPFLRPRPLDPPPESPGAQRARVGGAAGLVVLGALIVALIVRPDTFATLPTWFPAAAIWMLFWIVIAFGAAVHRSVARFVFSRLTLAVEFTALGIAYIVAAVFADVVAEEDAIIVAGIGSLTLFLGVVIGTALVARPIARVLGTRPVGVLAGILGAVIAIVASVGFVRAVAGGGASVIGLVGSAAAVVAGLALAIAGPALFGTIGKLARGNAMRNPRRTATTASALVIGMALICLVAVFVASAQDDTRKAIAGGVRADLVVSADQYAGFSAALTGEIQRLPDTEAAVALQYITAEINGQSDTVVGVTPEGIGTVLDLDFVAGSDEGLAEGGTILADFRAEEFKVGVGDTVTFTAGDGSQITAPVVGLYENDRFTGQQPAFVMVSSQRAEQIAGRVPSANQIFVRAKDGRVPELRQSLNVVLEQYPTVSVRTYQQFIDDAVGFIGQILNIFVALLFLSLLIALLGIINTLLLSVYERTRELGLLRAIGTSRLQVRRMIRGEAVIIAALGSIVGLVLGLVWSWVFVAAISGNGFRSFTIPWTQLLGFTALAAAAAVLASVIPAWRAGQLNVLEAIAEE